MHSSGRPNLFLSLGWDSQPACFSPCMSLSVWVSALAHWQLTQPPYFLRSASLKFRVPFDSGFWYGKNKPWWPGWSQIGNYFPINDPVIVVLTPFELFIPGILSSDCFISCWLLLNYFLWFLVVREFSMKQKTLRAYEIYKKHKYYA